MREITVGWTVNGIQSTSVLYFRSDVAASAQRLALFDFLDGIENYLAPACQWVVAPEGRELSEDTGTLTGFWTEPTAYVGSGQAVGQTVPDAAQGLIRFRTAAIVRGRLLQGRWFLPGLASSNLNAGNLTTGAVANINVEAAPLTSPAVSLVVWSRPVNGSGGVVADVDSATCWGELAVLRRRRR